MRLTQWEHLPGAREWRFVESVDWKPPPEFAHVCWYVIDPDSDHFIRHDGKPMSERAVYAHWRERLVPHEIEHERDGVKWPNVAWYYNAKPFYIADVSYDPVKRPVLICVAGFR